MMPITNSRAAGFACCLVFGLLTASATAFAADVLRFDIDATPTPPPSVMERPSLAPDIAQLEQRIPREHPRLMFRPGDFERLRARLDESPFREILQAMVEREEKLGESAGDNSCLLYQLTGERRYLDQAVELAWKLANKTLEELNYKTNQRLRGVSAPDEYSSGLPVGRTGTRTS